MSQGFPKIWIFFLCPIASLALDANHSFNDLKATRVRSAKIVSFANATLWQYNVSKDTVLNGFQIQEATFPNSFFDDFEQKRKSEVIRKKPFYGCRSNWGYLIINDSLFFSVPCGWRLGDNTLILLFRSADDWMETTFYINPIIYEKQEILCVDATKNKVYQSYFRKIRG